MKSEVKSSLQIYKTFTTVEEALSILNNELEERSRKSGFAIGRISIEGVDGDDLAKINAIKAQYEGIIQRASSQNTLPTSIK